MDFVYHRTGISGHTNSFKLFNIDVTQDRRQRAHWHALFSLVEVVMHLEGGHHRPATASVFCANPLHAAYVNTLALIRLRDVVCVKLPIDLATSSADEKNRVPSPAWPRRKDNAIVSRTPGHNIVADD
ncbi:hypothetical protein Trydic_g2727 [Trypoxylus dichotomus]